MSVTILVALQPDDRILFQISENDKALAHAILDREAALKIAADIRRLVERIPEDRNFDR